MSREFGRYPENIELKQWWGTRAIFKPYDEHCKVDILPDRQNYEGNRDESGDFIYWINNGFMKKLEKYFCELNANQSKVIRIESDSGQFIGEACCQNSGGYMYIGCWEECSHGTQ